MLSVADVYSLSSFFVDTWQYFLHRAMHLNKWLYKNVHSWHHRLYVPYAYGALYNHPVEGFLLDSLGSVIAEALTGMSVRQAMLLFTISTLKTVDDHCGYKLPFDPLQLMSSNNADYHDIHHQVGRNHCLYVEFGFAYQHSLGHWHQVQLRSAILRTLGLLAKHPHDTRGHCETQSKIFQVFVEPPHSHFIH